MKKEYPDKLVVLDIDGCITSIEDGTYFNPNPELYHPSEKLVNRIVFFCKEVNAKVLISSNWRKFDIDGTWKNKYGTFKNPLLEVKRLLADVYFDMLAPTRHVNKSNALKIWLEENRDFTGKFVIFDDDCMEKFQDTLDFGIKYKFVLVEPYYGISKQDLQDAKRILQSE